MGPSCFIRAARPSVGFSGRPRVIVVPVSTDDIRLRPRPGATPLIARTTCRPPWRIKSGWVAKACGPSSDSCTPISRAYSSAAGSALIETITRSSGRASVTTIRPLAGAKWSNTISSTGKALATRQSIALSAWLSPSRARWVRPNRSPSPAEPPSTGRSPSAASTVAATSSSRWQRPSIIRRPNRDQPGAAAPKPAASRRSERIQSSARFWRRSRSQTTSARNATAGKPIATTWSSR